MVFSSSNVINTGNIFIINYMFSMNLINTETTVPYESLRRLHYMIIQLGLIHSEVDSVCCVYGLMCPASTVSAVSTA